MTPRLVLFDVDGTLVDSQADILAGMAAGFAAADLPVPDRREVLSIVGLSLDQAIATLAPDATSDTHKIMLEAYRSNAVSAREAGLHKPPLYDGIPDLLRKLAAEDETVLGTATGKARRGLDHLILQHGLGGIFTTLQCADGHPSKPHPAMAETAMAETGIGPEHGIMIGDTSFDMELGTAAGMRTIGVTWGYHLPERLRRAGADVIVETVDALAATLEAWR